MFFEVTVNRASRASETTDALSCCSMGSLQPVFSMSLFDDFDFEGCIPNDKNNNKEQEKESSSELGEDDSGIGCEKCSELEAKLNEANKLLEKLKKEAKSVAERHVKECEQFKLKSKEAIENAYKRGLNQTSAASSSGKQSASSRLVEPIAQVKLVDYPTLSLDYSKRESASWTEGAQVYIYLFN